MSCPEFAKDEVNPGVLRWLSHGDERAMAIGENENGIAWMGQGKRQRALEVWFQSSLVPAFGSASSCWSSKTCSEVVL